jgi:photosystem II stability/assembly factor-like uncharacterized protein
MFASVQSKLVAAAGVAALVLGLLSGDRAAAPATSTAARPATGTPQTVLDRLGGTGLPRPESYTELAAANAAFEAAHGGLAGANLSAARLHAFAQAQTMPRALDASLSRAWKELGPKPFHADDDYSVKILGWDKVSGRVQVITPVPGDATGKRVWVGTAGGGAWYTSDSGTTWTPKFDRYPSLAVGAIAVDPTNTNVVYIGTGDANNCQGCYAGIGVYRSADNGATWHRAANNIKKDAAVARIEIAAGRMFVATNRGLFRSTDGGSSFHDVRLPTNAAATAPDSGVFGNVVSDVHVKPGSPSEIWAAVGWRAGKKNAPGNGLYRSTQGGAPGTWERLAVSGFGTPGRSSDPIGRISFTFAPQDPKIMWAIIQDAGLLNNETFIGLPMPARTNILNGVYRSGDGGETWELKGTSEQFQFAPGSGLILEGFLLYAPGVQSWYNQWVAVDPNDSEHVLVGLEEIYQTSSNADGPGLATWTTVGRYWNACLLLNAAPPCDEILGGPYAGMTTHPDQHAAALIKTAGGTLLYAGNDGGVYKQMGGTDGFDNEGWTSLNDTLGTTQAYYAVMGGDGTIYAGFQDNGTTKITPDGHASMVYGGDGFDVAVHPEDSKIAYEEYTNGAIAVTKDGGKTWSSMSAGVSNGLFSTPFEMDPKDPNHIVIGGRNIRETSRGPNTCVDIVPDVIGECYWATAYDLGYNAKVFTCDVEGVVIPLGNDCPEDVKTPTPYQMSGVDVNGTDVYAVFCGVCDVITQGSKSANPAEFENGVATNVKDGCTSRTASPDAPLIADNSLPSVAGPDPIGSIIGPEAPATCWHKIIRPKGLPNRYITDVEIDPADRKTIYVTLAGYARRWLPPDARTPGVGTGNVYVSHDAGKTFTNISGNLPSAPANAALVVEDALFVGTDIGVYSAPKSGGAWSLVGDGLPSVYVMDLNANPQGTKIVAATFGRGVWAYDLTGGSQIATRKTTKTSVLGTKKTRLPATGLDPATGVGASLLLSALLLRRRAWTRR